MKYKVRQSLHKHLEKDLNDEKEYEFFWLLCKWETEVRDHKEMLFTYLIKRADPNTIAI